MSDATVTFVGDREPLLTAINFCKPGAEGPKSSPDTNMLSMFIKKDAKRIKFLSRNAYVQCAAVVDLTQAPQTGRKLVVEWDKLQSLLTKTKKDDSITYVAPADGAAASLDSVEVRSIHGQYEFGLLDSQSFFEMKPKMRAIGHFNAAALGDLFDKTRVINGPGVYFVRFSTKKFNDKMYAQVLLRSDRELATLTIEAPDITEEFTVFLPSDALKHIQQMSAADMHFALPEDKDENYIQLSNPDPKNPSTLLLACAMEPNHDIEESLVLIKKRPDQEIKWDIKEMGTIVNRLEAMSRGDVVLTVPAGKTLAGVSVNNNKHRGSETIELTGSEIGVSQDKDIQLVLGIGTVRKLHKLVDDDELKVEYEQLKEDGSIAQFGVIHGKAGNTHYRVMFTIAKD